jgi:hypothetical protein
MEEKARSAGKEAVGLSALPSHPASHRCGGRALVLVLTLATSMAWSTRRLGEVGSGSGDRGGEQIRRGWRRWLAG